MEREEIGMADTKQMLPTRAPGRMIAPAVGGKRIAFVQAQWHADTVAKARDAFMQEMQRSSVPAGAIDVIEVPGAFEIPLHVKRLALSGRYAAIVGCALVADDGIYRQEYLAQTVIDSLMRVQLECNVPVLNAVLAPHHFHEHVEHRKYFQHHFGAKGEEAAAACIRTLNSLGQLELLLNR
jgi:6,7-dimethyl-8-ribityllumazine synthase